MRLKLFLFVITLLTSSVLATSYVMIHDDVLTDQARLVLVGGVERVESIVANPPYTRYHVRAERLLKGELEGETAVVDVLGGMTPSGSRLILDGSPSFFANDRLILFLVPRNNGSHGVLHLGLGAFRELRVGNRMIARRLLGNAVEIGSGSIDSKRFHQPRDFEQFANWLEDYSNGSRRQIDYFIAPSDLNAPISGSFALTPFTSRHEAFDLGNRVEWVAFEGGQPGLAGGGTAELEAAFDAWNADLNTNINQALTGTISENPGFIDDDMNTVSFGDPQNDVPGTFTCPGGGVAGIGGRQGSTTTHTHRDQIYFSIEEVDFVTNDGFECALNQDGGSKRRKRSSATKLVTRWAWAILASPFLLVRIPWQTTP